MKTKVQVVGSQVVCTFEVTTNYDAAIKLSPNEARNFKAQLEAVLKAMAQGDED